MAMSHNSKSLNLTANTADKLHLLQVALLLKKEEKELNIWHTEWKREDITVQKAKVANRTGQSVNK